MNKYIFNGNLGRTAEVRKTASGKTVCSFSVAVQEGYGDNQRTKWVKCALFGKRAEGRLPEFLTQGTRVLVTGNPQAESWINQSNEAQGQLSVFVDDIELLSASNEGHKAPSQAPPQQAPQQPQGFAGQPQQRPQSKPQGGGFDEFDEDIIPF